jgi:hypothetical protein
MTPRFLSRPWRRRLALGLPTVLGLRPRGWFLPHRYADQVRAPAAYSALLPLFRRAEPAFKAHLARLAAHGEDFAAIAASAGIKGNARWDQGWFPRLDAASAYALVRQYRPARVLEVGSGHSTRFVLRAVKDGGLATQVTAIDPAPRATLEGQPLTLIRQTLQRAGLAAFDTLAAGDLLMIDSSHLLMPGSDVDLLFAEVLPRLPPGVLIQVHDIFLPDGYPAAWAWRGYNEQQGLVGWLASGALRPVFASHYAATRLAAETRAAVGGLPLFPGALETALWLETASIDSMPDGDLTRS